IPLLDRSAPGGAKEYALANAEPRLAALARHLDGREYLLDAFSVADAYLFTVLNWSQVTPVGLDRFPAIVDYQRRLATRPSIARALAVETALFVAERGQPVAPPPSTRVVIDRFNDVFQRHDPSALDQLVGDDCVVENTQPAPDGERRVGKAACVAL